MATVLIATPQAEELEPLLETWRRLGHPSRPRRVGSVPCHAVPSLDLVAAVGGHGKAQYATETQHLVDRIDGLRSLVCVGAAGSLADRVGPGDVVVGTATVEHDYRLRFVERPPPCHEPSASLLGEVRETVRDHPFSFEVRFGRIASGDEDVVDPGRAEEIRNLTGALCVAWEGAGGARVASFNELGFLEVRGVTDAADADAAASFRENLKRVMPAVGQLLARWRTA